jgi:hypothetical protein
MDPERILKRFAEEKPEELVPTSPHCERGWQRLERLIRSAVRDADSEKSQELRVKVHQLQTQNELLKYDNSGLVEALKDKKHHKKRGKQLDLRTDEQYQGGAIFWSPQKVRDATARDREKKRGEEELALQKSNTKELKAAAALYKKRSRRRSV